LLRGSRVVLPPQGLKAVVIDLLHDGHPGSTQMKGLACSFVWWPGIDHHLEVKACDACQRTRHYFAQALGISFSPMGTATCRFAGPFMNKMFVDAYSKWLEVVQLSTAISDGTTKHLRSNFATHGLPSVFVTDSGSQIMKGNGI